MQLLCEEIDSHVLGWSKRKVFALAQSVLGNQILILEP